MARSEIVSPNRTAATTFGIFFLFGYVTYALGNILVQSIASSPVGLSNVYANKTQFIFAAAVLMSLLGASLSIGLAVIMLPILKRHNQTLTYGYFSAAITSSAMLIVGAIFLLLLVPLSDEFTKAVSSNTAYFQTLSILFSKGNFYAYQIGMAVWGLGGLMFCYLLYRTNLVPRSLSVWGFLGYVVFLSGTVLELFGYGVGLIFDIPGGLFELFLSVWLIAKGFNPSPVSLKAAVSTP